MNNLKIAKEIIRENFEDGDCGLFDTRNMVGDPMANLYNHGGLRIDICYRYSYFEVFGLTLDEFKELSEYYHSLSDARYEKLEKWEE